MHTFHLVLRHVLASCGVLAASVAVGQTNGNWVTTTGGGWGTATHWSSNPTVPGGAGAVIGLSNNITSNADVSMFSVSRTAGILNIGDSNNSHTFTLSNTGGTASLTLDNNASGAQINETGSLTDTISAPLILGGNVAISVGGTLSISGAISESGGARSITKTGTGTLSLSSANNTYTGITSVNAGKLALTSLGSFANSSSIIVGDVGSSAAVLDLTAKAGAFSIGAGQLLGGGGTVRLASSGTLNVRGTFSPGNSPGLFTYDGGTTVLSGTTLMEILGTSRATSPSHGTGFYDAVNVVNNGILEFGGNLTLEFASLFGDNTTFDLFTPAAGSSLAGNFTGVTVVGGFYTGLDWNQTGSTWKSSNTAGGQSLEFSSATGQLVIVVPEPGTCLLAGCGIVIAAGVAGYRRRRRLAGDCLAGNCPAGD